jgi:hypothetical protein
MKICELIQYPVAGCYVATAIILASMVGFAADQPDATKPHLTRGESNPEGYGLEIIDGALVRAGAKGGKLEATLANVVEALRERYTKANIVFPPGLGSLNISDVKLRAGSLWEELEAIRVASGSRFEWMGPNSPFFSAQTPFVSMPNTGAIDPSTGLPLDPNRVNNSGLFVLREMSLTSENERVVEAFNLGPYLEWFRNTQSQESNKTLVEKLIEESVVKVQGMISDTINTLKQGRLTPADQPSFQFHRGANLLIVIGAREAVEVARKVITALPGRPGQVSSPAQGEYGAPGPGGNPSNDAFRRRYGLNPAPPGPAPGTTPPR